MGQKNVSRKYDANSWIKMKDRIRFNFTRYVFVVCFQCDYIKSFLLRISRSQEQMGV